MPRVIARTPKKLSSKLLRIRKNLNLSQTELIEKLATKTELNQSQVSAFERGTRIPSLITVLAYAKLYEATSDVLIDDNEDLP